MLFRLTLIFVLLLFSNFGVHNLTVKEGTSALSDQRNHLVLCRYLHDLVISCNSLNEIKKKKIVLLF